MKKKIGILLLIIMVILIISFFIVNFIDKKITPIMMNYSKTEIKRIASIVINRSIRDDLLNDGVLDELFIVKRNDNDEIISITVDSFIVNKITNRISDACEDNLRKIEEGKYDELKNEFNIGKDYFLIPSGIIFTNSILSNFGPKIPINLKIIGNVASGIKADVKEYGINNSLITISVEIKVELMVILPLSTDYVSITDYVPIVMKLIQGKVPEIYGGNLLN